MFCNVLTEDRACSFIIVLFGGFPRDSRAPRWQTVLSPVYRSAVMADSLSPHCFFVVVFVCVACVSGASAVAASLTDVCLGRRTKADHTNVVWDKKLLSTGSNREAKLYRTRLVYSRESGTQSAGSPVGFAHGSGRDRCLCAVVGLAV